MPSVIFSPAARAELIEARDWYAARNANLADRFIVEVENVVARIAAAPQQFGDAFCIRPGRRRVDTAGRVAELPQLLWSVPRREDMPRPQSAS